MNTFRTGLLLAGLTGLFLAIGYLMGGQGGMMLAFLFAAGTTTFDVTHQYLDDNPSGTASDVYSVQLTLSDGDGGEDQETVAATVTNAARNVRSRIDMSPRIRRSNLK